MIVFIFKIKCIITRIWCFLTFGIPVLVISNDIIGWSPRVARYFKNPINGEESRLITGDDIKKELGFKPVQDPIDHLGYISITSWKFMDKQKEIERLLKHG